MPCSFATCKYTSVLLNTVCRTLLKQLHTNFIFSFNHSPVRCILLLLSPRWSGEFALGHTRSGSLAPAPVCWLPCCCQYLEVQGPEQEGKELNTRKLFPEVACNNGLLKATGSLTFI